MYQIICSLHSNVIAAVLCVVDKSTSKVDIKEEKTVEKDLGAGTADSTLGLAAPCTLCDGTLSEAVRSFWFYRDRDLNIGVKYRNVSHGSVLLS